LAQRPINQRESQENRALRFGDTGYYAASSVSISLFVEITYDA